MADTPAPAVTTTAPTPAAADAAPVDPRAAALAVLAGGAAPAEGKAGGGTAQTASAQTGAAPADAKAPPTAADGTASTAESGSPADEQTDIARQRETLRQGYAKLGAAQARHVATAKERDDFKAQLAEWNQRDAAIKADPAAVLDHFGLTLEQVAAAYLARETPDGPPPVEKAVADLQARIEARDKADADAKAKADDDAQARAAREAIDGGLKVVADTLAASPDEFPTITALGQEAEVFQVFSQYVAHHQVPAEQQTINLLRAVAREHEKTLSEDLAATLGKVPHIATRATAPAKASAPAGNLTASGATGTSSASLASAVVSEAPPPTTNGKRTKEELRALAIAVLQGGAAPS